MLQKSQALRFFLTVAWSHVYVYINAIKRCSYVNCQVFFFKHMRLEYGSIIIPPCLLYCSSASLFCQKKKGSTNSSSLHSNMRPAHHPTISIFVIEIWKVTGKRGKAMCVCVGGASLLLVTAYFSSSIHLSPQSISTQSSEDQNLISTCGTELKDIATLSRCIYLRESCIIKLAYLNKWFSHAAITYCSTDG